MSTIFFDFKLFKIADSANNTFYSCKNNKGIVILIQDDSLEEDLLLVKNIVQAIKMDYDNDIALVSLSKNSLLQYSNLIKDIEFSKIISFGVPFSTLGLGFEAVKNKPFFLQNKVFVEAYTPTEMNANPLLKKALWESLKSIFEL